MKRTTQLIKTFVSSGPELNSKTVEFMKENGQPSPISATEEEFKSGQTDLAMRDTGKTIKQMERDA